jgi:hypothetical protein
MNWAPVELLHLLVNAALQPICSAAHCRQEQKNAGVKAGVGIILQKDQLFFRRIRCLARKLRAHERIKKSGVNSRTVHSVRMPPFVVQAAYRTFPKTPALASGFEMAPKIHGQIRHWHALCSLTVALIPS